RFWTRLHHVPHTQADRRQDIPLFAIAVVDQRDARGPVRIVLDARHPRGDAVLRSLEIDNPVAALVAAPLVPHRELALSVPPPPGDERAEQSPLRLGGGDVIKG